MSLKAKGILLALEKRHSPLGTQWAFYRELRAGTGYGIYDYEKKKKNSSNPEQRFDAWAINLYPSKKHERIAYEIKVSRGDFLHEIKNPEKREQALELSNYFYFATPKGLVDVDEIPPECGLIEVDHDLNTRIKLKAPFRRTDGLSWQFLCSIARRGMVSK
jgi:hypothetical protein